MISNSLRMIAGGRGNHSMGALFAGEGEQLIQRAALFEGTGALLIVEFKKDLASW